MMQLLLLCRLELSMHLDMLASCECALLLLLHADVRSS
jgi:hypothetical protein